MNDLNITDFIQDIIKHQDDERYVADLLTKLIQQGAYLTWKPFWGRPVQPRDRQNINQAASQLQ
jgi:hypothetical protein